MTNMIGKPAVEDWFWIGEADEDQLLLTNSAELAMILNQDKILTPYCGEIFSFQRNGGSMFPIALRQKSVECAMKFANLMDQVLAAAPYGTTKLAEARRKLFNLGVTPEDVFAICSFLSKDLTGAWANSPYVLKRNLEEKVNQSLGNYLSKISSSKTAVKSSNWWDDSGAVQAVNNSWKTQARVDLNPHLKKGIPKPEPPKPEEPPKKRRFKL